MGLWVCGLGFVECLFVSKFVRFVVCTVCEFVLQFVCGFPHLWEFPYLCQLPVRHQKSALNYINSFSAVKHKR